MLIDLHHHILPGLDDGPAEFKESLEMARIAVSEGFKQIVCTPHIYPGVYQNDRRIIQQAIRKFQRILDEKNIPLKLLIGADIRVTSTLLNDLQTGHAPTINGGNYFLAEPPHVDYPIYLKDAISSYLAAGYTPILTHPERLSWAQTHYNLFEELVEMGCWIQITAASLTGFFGKPARRLSFRMLADGLVHVVATDAHSASYRKPEIRNAFVIASKLVGAEEANNIFYLRPQAVVNNLDPQTIVKVPTLALKPAKRFMRKCLVHIKSTLLV